MAVLVWFRRAFVALAVGFLSWFCADWLLTPRPVHTCVSALNFDTIKSFRTTGGYWIHDAAMRYLAWKLPAQGETRTKDRWRVYDLRLPHDQGSEHQWQRDEILGRFSHARGPFNHYPIENGTRVVRRAKDGSIEVVDRHFPECQEIVRVRTRANIQSKYDVQLSRNGKTLVILEHFPTWQLRILGSSGMPAWDVLALHHLNSGLKLQNPPNTDGMLVHAFDVEMGQRRVSFHLPPPNPHIRHFELSPNGQWLVRPEVVKSNQYGFWFDQATYPKQNNMSERLFAAEPRGMFVYNLLDGSQQVFHHFDESLLVAYSASVGNQLLHNPGHRTFFRTSTTPPHINVESGEKTDLPDGVEPAPVFQIQTGQLIGGGSNLRRLPFELQLSSSDDQAQFVGTLSHSPKEGSTYVLMNYSEQGFAVCSPAITLDERYRFIPLAASGLVMVSRNALKLYWHEWVQRTAQFLGVDLNRLITLPSESDMKIVDLKRGAILFEDAVRYYEAQGDEGYQTSYDGKAIIRYRYAQDGLHFYRWDLPVAVWSRWWSRGAGVLAAVLVLWVWSRCKKPKVAFEEIK